MSDLNECLLIFQQQNLDNNILKEYCISTIIYISLIQNGGVIRDCEAVATPFFMEGAFLSGNHINI